MLKAIINIHLKDGVLDSAGKTTQTSLNMIGFDNIDSVNIGKQIIITLDENDKEKAQQHIEDMCKALLVNDVIEDYYVEII
jgi:phosphoribosylformylglycinamidine synthase